jgi:hypothetical protein
MMELDHKRVAQVRKARKIVKLLNDREVPFSPADIVALGQVNRRTVERWAEVSESSDETWSIVYALLEEEASE